jgi:tRNA(Ile)-lysidine synthase
LVVAVSGGEDSAALLWALVRFDETAWAAAGWSQPPALAAVHCHHGLSPAADHLQATAIAAARAVGLDCALLRLSISIAPGDSVEAIARLHRYQALAGWLPSDSWLLTAHHADDQAETFLLQALRGAGLEGLAAMPWAAPLGQGWHVRPLLATTRSALRHAGARYGLQSGLHFTADPMNDDPHLDRVYLRQALWPALTARWPAAATTLARAAGHLQDALSVVDAAVLEDLTPLLAPFACRALPALPALAPDTLEVAGLSRLPLARRAQVMRAWVRGAGHRSPPTARVGTLTGQLLEARGDAAPCVRWGPSEVHSWRGRLYLRRTTGPTLVQRLSAAAPPAPPWREGQVRMAGLPVPLDGTAVALGAAGWLCLTATDHGPRLRQDATQAFVVRGRVGGERLQRRLGAVQVHQEVRKLLQAAAIPPWLRDEVPFLWQVPLELLSEARRTPGTGRLVAVGDTLLDAQCLAEGTEPGWRVEWTAPVA